MASEALRSDCADVQADLKLHCLHMSIFFCIPNVRILGCREAEEGETNVAAKKNYKKKFGKIKAMENYLNVRQHGERASTGGRTLSDSEDNDMEEEEAEAIPKEKSKSRSKYSWIRKVKAFFHLKVFVKIICYIYICVTLYWHYSLIYEMNGRYIGVYFLVCLCSGLLV